MTGWMLLNKKGISLNYQAENKLRQILIILSISVRPENDLAISAGLKVGEHGGILVNDYIYKQVMSLFMPLVMRLNSTII